MHRLFTFLESDENYARVLKWTNVVIGAVGVSMLGMFLIAHLNK
ncbi:hypothetical protein SAMN05444172_2690 [Burkholderia sp. GAS332]|jgi:hypothetical protein|nr:hypothetical protein SAMN05444172_2690 [Burkholderia sp. GAS332]